MTIKKSVIAVFGCLFFVPVLVTSCVSQRDIEIACLQTISALTPICVCESATQSPANGTLPTSPPITVTTTPEVIQPLSPSLQVEMSPSPTNYSPIFYADFESGDFSAFTEPNGEYFGKGVFYDHKIVSAPAIGNYSAALTIGSGDSTAAYLFTYRTPSTPLAIYSADYWIPSEIIPDDWWNVWQWKSVDQYFDKPVIDLNILRIDGILQVVMFYTPGSISTNETQGISQTKPISFPTDKWVNITAHFLSKDDGTGFAAVFQDGQKILELTNIYTRPGNEPVLWSVNSYADRMFPDPATIYIDNMTIDEAQ